MFQPMRVLLRRQSHRADAAVLIGTIALIFAVLQLTKGMVVPFNEAQQLAISLDVTAVPYYAGRSLIRMFLALFASVVFALVYGYACAYSRARVVLLPVLDILQSVPILGFLSVTVVGFMALFPGQLLGVELASIFAIFTSMAWNLITILHERSAQDPRFQALVDRIYTIMTNPHRDLAELRQAMPDAAPLLPAEPARVKEYQALPHAKPGAVAGLLELLDDRSGSEDLYKLGHDLHLEVDDLLPIIEAAEILGLAAVREGELRLTTAGSVFLAADILPRKELFRQLVLERVQLIVMIERVLVGKTSQAMPEAFFLDRLNRHFSQPESRRQLQTAIDWGRYAELFAYDERSQQLYLE
ncbi:MAG: AAA-associated domain-containing protein [Candidatus Sericytochromatia bacterium]|nr:AAA-associated domain-containing protein [Candidatus Sericytochromatia bacterium]